MTSINKKPLLTLQRQPHYIALLENTAINKLQGIHCLTGITRQHPLMDSKLRQSRHWIQIAYIWIPAL